MQKRISHTKSRKGCRNCKNRHVKCDEQGPPCFNCVVRSTTETCSLTKTASRTPPRLSKTPPAASSSDLSRTSSPPPLTRVVSASSQSRHLLELRLMHRWSTSTYQSFCSTVYDPPWLQVYLPECALEYDYLLYGIFAMSSLDLIIGGTVVDEAQTRMHFQAALEYYDKASESFRRQLNKITPKNFHSMYMFAFMAAVMYMARPLYPLEQRNRQSEGIIGRAAVVMKLLMACCGLAEQNIEVMLDVNGVSRSSMTTTITAVSDVVHSPQFLGTSTEEALARLTNLVEIDALLNLGREASSSSSTASYHNAVRWLRVSFGMEARYNETVVGFCLAWPALAGTDFVDAFGKADVMAMVIVMHWAVLLDRLGSLAWWAASMGRDLVREVSRTVLQSKAQVVVGPEIHQSIEWARQQVGLTSELELGFPSINPSFMAFTKSVVDSSNPSNV